MHKKFLERMKLSKTEEASETDLNQKLISDTKMSTIFICHPQLRNPFRKIFGGNIMREALEIAHINAFVFSRQRPNLIGIDDILFLQPVDIGSFLCFRSCIGYVKGNVIHIPVFAEAIDPTTGDVTTSNMVHFTFTTNPKKPLPELTFDSYFEAMIYLNSRRQNKKMLTSRDTAP